MGLRITTWNVNGIRYVISVVVAMFDTLEADIVIMQEAKIQRYSGVAIYTRNSKCCPIRAEEGLTGTLCPRKSTIKFRDLPADQQIGGYPREDQIIGPVDEVILDSEGRAVILEFPAFVLIGVYVPATRDDTRTDFRMGFMSILDARIRNLVAMGKQVVLAGDLNIIRSDIDTAGCADQLRKEGMTLDDFLSTPSRRLFNQLIFEGQVIGERDEGRGEPVMWDITRTFHPNRQGMFTCWETKKNARPGNFGSRIDYILCTAGLKKWFEDSNIQEGLMGSDHCPVYATMADCTRNGSKDVHIADLMNREGMFKEGKRLREWSTRDMLPQSARLLTEFDRRRSIKDMFAKNLAAPKSQQASKDATESTADTDGFSAIPTSDAEPSPTPSATPVSIEASSTANLKSFTKTASPKATPKRAMPNISGQPQKRMKTATSKDRVKPGPAQSTLKGFFRPKTTTSEPIEGILRHEEGSLETIPNDKSLSSPAKKETDGISPVDGAGDDGKEKAGRSASDGDETGDRLGTQDDTNVFDPIHSKESWSRLLGGKRVAPLCEHGQPCISYVVKKPGINCGRTFYMCSRPLGPSGQKEKNTQWRCATFIWARNAESRDASTS
ncbi:DNA-(apurinic or apyrimidinic site) lyase 2 [Cytospora mali]|uniref:DNA-(apurinic or apyrimidinic site) endonuclease 2 n=1 Tax=Cytospora mali TaxID=578113 RepID=A0A194W8Z0_CYTMA|nr:DNA-(apurinic or apyrimidinic site) lyase 2 [Valsa mali]